MYLDGAEFPQVLLYLRNSAGMVVGSIPMSADIENVRRTTVPTLGETIDSWTDHFGIPDSLVLRLHEALGTAHTLNEFASAIPNLSYLELRWIWLFAELPLGSGTHRVRYTKTIDDEDYI